jgi:hypothetical protein
MSLELYLILILNQLQSLFKVKLQHNVQQITHKQLYNRTINCLFEVINQMNDINY